MRDFEYKDESPLQTVLLWLIAIGLGFGLLLAGGAAYLALESLFEGSGKYLVLTPFAVAFIALWRIRKD